MLDRIFVKKRALNHQQKFDRVLDILENCKFDIAFMVKTHPMSDADFRYFQDQVARINGAIQFVQWFRDNMFEKKKRFFGLF